MPHLTLARRVSWFQRRYEKQLTGHAPPRDGSFDDASFHPTKKEARLRQRYRATKDALRLRRERVGALLAPDRGSGVDRASPSRHREGVASTAWRSTRRFSERTTQVGSCLAVPPPGVERDPSALLDALSKSCASVAFFAPSQLGAVLEVNESSSLQSLRLDSVLWRSPTTLRGNPVFD